MGRPWAAGGSGAWAPEQAVAGYAVEAEGEATSLAAPGVLSGTTAAGQWCSPASSPCSSPPADKASPVQTRAPSPLSNWTYAPWMLLQPELLPQLLSTSGPRHRTFVGSHQWPCVQHPRQLPARGVRSRVAADREPVVLDDAARVAAVGVPVPPDQVGDGGVPAVRGGSGVLEVQRKVAEEREVGSLWAACNPMSVVWEAPAALAHAASSTCCGATISKGRTGKMPICHADCQQPPTLLGIGSFLLLHIRRHVNTTGYGVPVLQMAFAH